MDWLFIFHLSLTSYLPDLDPEVKLTLTDTVSIQGTSIVTTQAPTLSHPLILIQLQNTGLVFEIAAPDLVGFN